MRRNLKQLKCEIQNSRSSENGFTLIEAVIAMVILMIVAFGIAGIFTQSVRLNSGNSTRTQALTIAQHEVEQLRAARFSDAVLNGGTKNPVVRTGADNQLYRIEIAVDNDPFTAGVQDQNQAPNSTLKEITVTITPVRFAGFEALAAPVVIITRRTRGAI